MKYLKEVAIIFGITMAGEFLNYLLPLPVPAGVYGLFILLLLLCAGTLKVEDVSEVGDFFLDNSVDEAKSILVPLTVISVVSTVFVMAVTGRVAQNIIRGPKKRKGGKEV